MIPVSKTQLEYLRSCERKFAWSYLERVEGLPNKYALLGIEIHQELEKWLKEQELPSFDTQAGKIAAAGIPELPHPTTPGLLVEAEVWTITEQALYHGFGDFVVPPVHHPHIGEDDIIEPSVAIIGDHKSTGDFKWALTPEALDTDIQANIYTRAVMGYYGVEEADAYWLYYRTRSTPKVHPVRRRLTLEGVEKTFLEVIDPLAARIQELREGRPRALDLEPNVRACSDYGGCGFRDLCTDLDARARLKGRFAHMGLVDKLKAKNAGINPPEAGKKPAETPPKPAEESAKTSPGPVGLAARIKAKSVEKPAEKPASTTDTPIEQAIKKAVDQEKKSTPASVGAFMLCAGCVPMGVPYLEASDRIAAARAVVEAEAGVPDYRLVDFNRGAGMLTAAVRQSLADDPYPEGSYVFLDIRTPEGRDSFEAFRDAAMGTIRAF